MPEAMTPKDPAWWLMVDAYRSSTDLTLEDPSCYICRDPDYAQMGLPLCYACFRCGGHVPADDPICTVCKADQQYDDPRSEWHWAEPVLIEIEGHDA